MSLSSIRQHIEITHKIVLPKTQGVDVDRGRPDTYVVFFPQILKSVVRPVAGGPARSKKPGRLREHFMSRHWKANVDIVQEVTEQLPR